MQHTGNFWNKCPFCGAEALQGTVEDTYADVELGPDGPPAPDARQLIESEVTYIRCTGCGKEVEPYHYYGHGGGDCDCTLEEEEENDEHGEHSPETD